MSEVSKYVSVENSDDSSSTSEKIDFDSLNEINSSCIGWLNVPATNIDYPVVQYTNNDYYLSHSFDNTENSAGWIFADYRNSCDGYDKNLVIYGHNRKNKTMFSTLKNVLEEDWYKNPDNQYVTLSTSSEDIKYQVFSVYSIEVETYFSTTTFLSDSSYQTFLDTLQKRSIYNFDVPLSKDDTILTLSTCSDNSAYRTILHAKKVQSPD